MDAAGIPALALALCLATVAAGAGLQPKPVPRMQAVPQPYHQVSFQRDGREVARYHFGQDLDRPFLFPVIGPSGRPLTRMGHPHDPEGHGHHNSVWVSHNSVNGADFWANGTGARIIHRRLERLDDGPDSAAVISLNDWVNTKQGKTLLKERRTVTVQALPGNELLIVVDLELSAEGADVTLGKTPFGFFAVRMAKTIGVHDGAGTLRNSEGGVDEKGVFWKRAKWMDYSGAVADGVVEGIALLDHPSNANHPSIFHVRDDGWMGAAFTQDAPRTIPLGEPLKLRYGLWVHAALPDPKAIEAKWDAFTKLPLPEPRAK
ncbi:MAG TPA: PmoA family protein [Planctomycetota bacterium]|nr:PmoA family protein [Planctomycetota bacterium]HRT94461.1 PmoA family protein [Planctomycetota bacterium]